MSQIQKNVHLPSAESEAQITGSHECLFHPVGKPWGAEGDPSGACACLGPWCPDPSSGEFVCIAGLAPHRLSDGRAWECCCFSHALTHTCLRSPALHCFVDLLKNCVNI